MKRLTLLVLLMISTNTFANKNEIFTMSFFIQGPELITWLKDERYKEMKETYITGVYEALQLKPGLICTENSVSIPQLVQIIYNYIQKNPTTWNEPAVFIVQKAILESYPCKK